jgi:hypothetical protein
VVEQHLLPHPHFLHLQIMPPPKPKSSTLRLTPHPNPTNPSGTHKKIGKMKMYKDFKSSTLMYTSLQASTMIQKILEEKGIQSKRLSLFPYPSPNKNKTTITQQTRTP